MSNKIIERLTNLILVFMVIILSGFIIIQPYSYVSQNNANNAFYYGDKNSNNISLMFNVYWGNDYIESIIKELKSRNVKATFFIGGIWAQKYPEILNKIYISGNELGNHGYNHREHSKLNYEQNQDEILKTNNLVYQQCGVCVKLFAPPFGDYNSTTVNAAYHLGCYTILWTRDTIDWRDQDVNLIYNRATKNMSGGDLILMHPTKATLLALPKILDYCIQNNFKVTTVSETICI